ncbi:MAG: 50S ribosomal protein L19 [Bacilli bacterium]
MNLVEIITKKQIRTDLPEFRVGDTVVVGWKVVEGKRERIQDFEGIVIKIQNSGIGKNFTVRKLSGGVGVERTFPMNSPVIAYVKVARMGRVRRAKLNFLRTLKSQPKIKERRAKETKAV